MAAPDTELLGTLLAAVSRSFYLTLRVLPRSIRRPIGLAYLLARATDTIADTADFPVARRLDALDQLRHRIAGTRSAPLDFTDLLARQPGSIAEQTLLARINDALDLLESCAASDRDPIRHVLEIISSGQELDLRRFDLTPTLSALPTLEALEDYTYRVAGCVGEFWTRLCRLHLFPRLAFDEALLNQRAVRFGQGLQLVNILRDLPGDLQRRRCYLPESSLETAGLAPDDLLDPTVFPRFSTLYGEFLDRAESHLAAGWNYTNMLPHRQVRVRLACAWPVLIGLRTLARLRLVNPLDPSIHTKINRREVRAILFQSVWRYPWPAAWQRLFERSRR